ncbi:helix-turn-helix domain-containing protein [Nocardioides sp.]|uniref:arsenate reductase/protein-tyrosine-phosphatase family protein n=1 Tax=Nocardioides sp. TaxID=35761 RepID=UPI003513EB05
MNIEQTSDLERRAAVHAALGDAMRLRIIDTLRLGDASPSELSAALGAPSNLLAFHLRALEAAGLITRHRSEGDGRRTYLRLVADALDDLGPRPLLPPERVVFVCTANSARSHLAAAIWREASPIPGLSAGTRPAPHIDPGAVDAAARHGLDLPEVRPQHVDGVIGDGDLVVTVCDLAHEELGPTPRLHWSIPDPVRAGSAAAFDHAYAELTARVRDLAGRYMTAS